MKPAYIPDTVIYGVTDKIPNIKFKKNMKKVYGVRIDEVTVNAADIQEMNDEEKFGFVCRNHDKDQVYTVDAFFYYLNSDMLDTENYYWIMA